MIKENQRLLNQFNVITDGVSVLFTLLLAFWVRFFLLPGGEISVRSGGGETEFEFTLPLAPEQNRQNNA